MLTIIESHSKALHNWLSDNRHLKAGDVNNKITFPRSESLSNITLCLGLTLLSVKDLENAISWPSGKRPPPIVTGAVMQCSKPTS